MPMTHSELKAWLGPKELEIKSDVVHKLLAEARQERLHKDESSAPDYGYSFPDYLKDAQVITTSIRQQAETSESRPHVADIGAGFGSMTWKLLAAGAKVDAFELQTKSAQELSARLKTLPACLLEGHELDTRLTVTAGDALTHLKEEAYRHKYDFVWMGNVIHFMSPKQIKQLNKILRDIVKPGGKVLCTSHTINGMSIYGDFSEVKRAFTKSDKAGVFCPGFMAINVSRLDDGHGSGMSICRSVYTQKEMTLNGIPLQPQAYQPGIIGPKPTKKLAYSTASFPYQSDFHVITNYFTPASAHEAFKDTGFHINAAYVNLETGLKVPDTTTCQTIRNVILMEKPRSSALKPMSGIALGGGGGGGAPSDDEACAEIAYPPLTSGPSKQFKAMITFFEPTIESKLRQHIEAQPVKARASLRLALENKNYGLLLRKASSVALCPIIKTLLANVNELKINLLETSKNGHTALDWLIASTNDHPKKLQCIKLLAEMTLSQRTDDYRKNIAAAIDDASCSLC